MRPTEDRAADSTKQERAPAHFQEELCLGLETGVESAFLAAGAWRSGPSKNVYGKAQDALTRRTG